MPLFGFFECHTHPSAPQRRNGERTLPLIPNEIYLLIFQHIWHLQTLARLRVVCKCFANATLPRMFEEIMFCSFQLEMTPAQAKGDVFFRRRFAGRVLFFQIAGSQPASLILAKSVRCLCVDSGHADGWRKGPGLTPKDHLSSISLMTRLRQLELENCLVDVNHWCAIASLSSLEELCFRECKFLPNPPGVKPETTDKLRLSLLKVTLCDGHFQPMVPVDARNLRTLEAPLNILLDIDFLPQSALTELTLGGSCRCYNEHAGDLHVIQMRGVLEILPHTIQTLSISIFDFVESVFEFATEDVLRFIFASPAWSNFHHLHSLVLEINHAHDDGTELLSVTLDGTVLLADLQSLVVHCLPCWDGEEPGMPFSDIQPILRDKLGRHSCLTHMTILGTTLHLVNGEWSEVESSEASEESSEASEYESDSSCTT